MWVQSLGWEYPLEKEMEPTPVFWPIKSHGQGSLVGYSLWCHKASDTTEHTHTTAVYCPHLFCSFINVRCALSVPSPWISSLTSMTSLLHFLLPLGLILCSHFSKAHLLVLISSISVRSFLGFLLSAYIAYLVFFSLGEWVFTLNLACKLQVVSLLH